MVLRERMNHQFRNCRLELYLKFPIILLNKKPTTVISGKIHDFQTSDGSLIFNVTEPFCRRLYLQLSDIGSVANLDDPANLCSGVTNQKID